MKCVKERLGSDMVSRFLPWDGRTWTCASVVKELFVLLQSNCNTGNYHSQAWGGSYCWKHRLPLGRKGKHGLGIQCHSEALVLMGGGWNFPTYGRTGKTYLETFELNNLISKWYQSQWLWGQREGFTSYTTMWQYVILINGCGHIALNTTV